MAVTSWTFPGTAVGNRPAAGVIAWTTPDNIKADDGNSAQVILTQNFAPSFALAAVNFDFSAVPDGDRLEGIEVRVGDYNTSTNSASPSFTSLRLVLPDDSDGVISKHQDLPTLWTTTLQTRSYGGNFDLWSESLTIADIKDADFGFLIAVDLSQDVTVTFNVDYMQIRIYHGPKTLPSPIFGTGAIGHHPPWKSSGGSFYIVSLDGVPDLQTYKADGDNPEGFWVPQDTANNPDDDHNPISVYQDGDNLHIATWDNSSGQNDYKYHLFNMATDSWDVANEDIDDPANDPDQPWISIAVRSDGDVIVAYSGDSDKDMGKAFERVDYARREGGTWGSNVGIALDAGVADEHYGNPNLVKGPLTDDMHIIWQHTAVADDPPTTWTDIEGRTLNPSNSLSTLDTDTHDTFSILLGLQNILSYDDSGTQRMMGIGATGTQVLTTRSTEDGSDDLQFDTFSTSNISPTIGGVGELAVVSITELNGDLHIVYRGDTDLFYSTSTDDAVTWGTPVEELDGITLNNISANIYVRDGDTVLAYFYDDNGLLKYNEKILIVGGGGGDEGAAMYHHLQTMGVYS